MTRLDSLKHSVEILYTANDSKADVWIDWAYPNHVLVVAALAERIAKVQGANVEFVVAGALLHDIADAVMTRRDPKHAKESLAIATRLLQENGYSEADISFILHEVIEPHSCSDILPTTLEGKVMATADGAAHFTTDFFTVFCWRHYGPKDDYQVFKNWVAEKTEKHFTKKIFFDDIKEEIRPRYEALRLIFLD